MQIKFTKTVILTVLSVLIGHWVNAQSLSGASSYDLQFANLSTNCNGVSQLCADIQIKAAAGASDFVIGSHTVGFSYALNAINHPAYTPESFDTSVVCIGAGGFTYKPFQFIAFSFSEDGSNDGLANFTTTLQFYIPGFECPVVSTDWSTMGHVCFDIVDETAATNLAFDPTLTTLNIGSNAATPQHAAGQLSGSTQSASGFDVSASAVTTPAACPESNGSVCFTLTGTAPFNIAGPLTAQGVDSGFCFDNAPQGTHTFVVTDASGCNASVTVEVGCFLIGPPVCTFELFGTTSPATCGTADGSVCFTMTGTPPFNIDGPLTAQGVDSGFCFDNAPQGIHTFTVTDANACDASVTVEVACFLIGPPVCTFELFGTTSPATCGTADGSVCFTMTGTPPFNIDGPLTAQGVDSGFCFDNAPQGIHTFTVTDANACDASVTVEVACTPVVIGGACQAAISSSAAPTACTATDGSVCFNLSGGTPPYTIQGNWGINHENIAAGEHCIENLAANDYNFTVYDAAGCSVADLTANFACTNGGGGTGGDCPSLTASVSTSIDPTCGTNDGKICITIGGGTAPYSINGNWGLVANLSEAGEYCFENLGQSLYNFSIYDLNGCSKTLLKNLNCTGGPPPSNNCTFTTNITTTSATCGTANGSVCFFMNGGTAPYDIVGPGSFSGNDLPANYCFSDVPTGVHTFVLTDANACQYTVIANVTCTGGNPNCNGLSIGFTDITPDVCDLCFDITGGTAPFDITGALTATDVAANYCFAAAPAGTHTFTVTDANGCSTTTTTEVNCETSPTCNLSATNTTTAATCGTANGAVCFSFANGTAPYDITGPLTAQDVQSGFCFTNAPQGTHTFTITDANGCTATTTAVVDCTPVTNPCSSLAVSVTTTPAYCNDPVGSVCFTITGGTAPFDIAGPLTAQNVQSGFCLQNAPAGIHTFTIQDALNCQTTVTAVVNCSGNNENQEPPIANNDFVYATAGQANNFNPLANDGATNDDTFSLLDNSNPIHGTLTINGNNFVYTPNTNFSGNDSFIYTICDNDGCSTATVVLVVAGNCNNPDNLCLGMYPNNIDVCVNFCDVSDAEITDWHTTYNCSISLQGNNCLTYTPLPGFYGNETLTLTGCNAQGQCDTIIVELFVGDGCPYTEGTPPVAINDNATTALNTTVSINVIANDQQTENDPFGITTFTQPANGTVTQNGGQLVYTPNNGYVGTDVFSYTICDNDGCSTATVTVTVTDNGTPIGTPPIANNDYAGLDANTTYNVYVLDNDAATEGDPFSISTFTQPTNGTVTQNGNILAYTPNTDYTGTDQFTYTICDDDGCSTATVYLWINGVTPPPTGTPPIAQNDYAGLAVNTTYNVYVLENDQQTENDPFSISTFTQPANGTVTQNGNILVYTPNNNYIGTDQFTYTICDDDGCSTATVYLWINEVVEPPTGTPPVANNDSANTNEDSPVTINVTANDAATEGDPFSITTFTQPAHGTVTQSGSSLIYTPANNYNGTDQFTYTICDDDGCSTATVFINVIATCSNPDNLCFGMYPDNESFCIDFCNVPDATIQSWTTLYNCSVSLTGDNCLTYTPLPGFYGDDMITLIGCNDAGLCDTVYVNLHITQAGENCPSVGTPPIANNDYVSTPPNTPITIDVTTNDQQTEGDEFTITTFTQPANGTVTQNGNSLVYTPNNGFVGSDQFTYTICDDDGCSTATVFVYIEGNAQTPPVAVDDYSSTPFNTAINIDVTANDQQTDGDEFTITTFTQPANGTVTQNGNLLTYTPNNGFVGEDTFTYTICDNDGCSTATVHVYVSNGTQETPPVAVDDYSSTPLNTAINIDVTANDQQTDGDEFTITTFTQPANGTVTQNGNLLTYTPNNGFVGEDTFTYTICDNDGCSTATVHVYINGEPTQTPPIANNDYVTTPVNTPININATTNDQQTDGDSFTITTFTQPTHGTVTLVDGVFNYVPNNGYIGEDMFDYTICDDDGCSTAMVYIYIQEAPPACDNPELICMDAFPDNLEVCIDFCNVTDAVIVDFDTYFHCSVQLLGNNCVQYTPLPGFVNQTDTLFLYGCNNAGQCDTVSVLIQVAVPGCGTNTNNPPIAIDDYSTTPQNTPVTINVLNNDSDPDGDTFAITSFTQPANGSVTLVDGAFLYEPNNNFCGTDQFDYQICDASGLCDLATVYIDVACTCDGTQYICAEPLQPITICATFCDIQGTEGIHIVDSQTTFQCSINLLNDTCIQYTALPGYNGHDTLTLVACNDAGVCDTTYIYLFVGCAAPVAVDDAFSTPNNLPGVFDVLANDFIACSDSVLVTINTQPAHGEVTVNTNGDVIYVPEPGYLGTDVFTYTVCDYCNLTTACDQATVTVTVTTPTDDLVDAQPDVVQTPFNTPVTINVLANDLGTNLTITSVTQPMHGTLSINADGTITYTPTEGTYGPDYFFYTVCNDLGQCDETLVSITVLPEDAPNQAPNANNDVAVTPLNTSVTINVLANDSDPENGTLTVTAVTQPAHGTVVINADGTITYTPEEGYMGVDTFSYTVCDNGVPPLCSTATVGVAVGMDQYPNHAPIAIEDMATTPQGTPVSINVLANDSDPDAGDVLTITIISEPVNGTVVVSGDSTILYAPYPDFEGIDYIAYMICDNGIPSLCDTAYVVITVGDGNMGPTAIDDQVCTTGDPLEVDVLNNDEDENGDELYVSIIIEQPQYGEAFISLDQSFVGYVPFVDAPATIDSFTYIVCEAFMGGLCDTATVYISIDAPIAPQPDIAYTNQAQAVDIDVLNNDGGYTPSIAGFSQPENGSVAFSDGGNTLIYTPNDDFSGVDYFYYQATDCSGNTTETLVAVNVLPEGTPNLAPIAGNDTGVTEPNTPVTINVLANDIDPNGDTLTVTQIIDQPTNGTVTINDDGTVTYTPNEDYIGCDLFSYQVCDGEGLCDTAYVQIGIGTDSCLNNAPIALNDEATTPTGTDIVICVLANDTDPDGDALILTLYTDPLHGTLTLNEDSCLVYTPDSSYIGNDQFVYIVCDTGIPQLCDTAYVTITVGELPPVEVDAQPDIDYTNANTPVEIDVLANDFGTNLTITSIVTQPTNGGTAVITGSTITYTPPTDFVGTDNFEYEVCDNNGNCDITLVTVVVLPESVTNVAPDAVNDVAQTEINTPICVDVLANDFDSFGGDMITLTDYTQPEFGEVVLDTETGALCFTPAPDFIGTVTFSYTICDNGTPQLCDEASVVITVGLGQLSNNPPLAVDDEYTIPMTESVSFDLIANDTDPDGDNLFITFLSDPIGDVINNFDGTVTYTPVPDSTYTDFFAYVLCDDGNPILCDTAYVTITIVAALDSVIAQPDIDYTNVNTPVTIDVLANDFGTGISVTSVTTPINGGTVSIDADGVSVTYTPATDFVGTDYFTYTICDDLGNCDSTLVTVNVLPETVTNIAPVAVNDVAVTPIDAQICIDVLDNDFDAFGGTIIFINFYEDATANGGTVVQQDDSTLCYTPAPGFAGIDSFHYVICDDGNPILCDTATVVIGVGTDTLPNNPPVAVDDAATTFVNQPVTFDILGNDSDPNGDEINITFISDPLGDVVQNLDGTITYTPPTGYEGVDYFAYIICDNGTPTLCDTAYVTINITPVTGDILIETPEDTPDTLCIEFLVSSGLPIDTISIVTAPENGTIEPLFGSDSCLVYIPNPDYCGVDQFVIAVCDSLGTCDTLTVGVTVVCMPEGPMAIDDATSTTVDTPITIDVLANDVVDATPAIIISIPDAPSNGTAVIVGDSIIIYTPNDDFYGTDTFTYVIEDANGMTDTATVIVTISIADDDVLAIDDTTSTPMNTPITIDVLGNDIYPEGTTVITIIDDANNGTAVVTANGDSILYTPNEGFMGADTFYYQLCVTTVDTTVCDTAMVIVTVTELVNPPICDLVFANTFTPNGDGTNDLWLIANADDLEACYEGQEINPELMIYNRWGDMVYHQVGYTNNDAWNGEWMNTGSAVPDGTYFYIFRVSPNAAKEATTQGFIELRR
jgi:gliding motility-associated-like protein